MAPKTKQGDAEGQIKRERRRDYIQKTIKVICDDGLSDTCDTCVDSQPRCHLIFGVNR